MRKQFYEYLYLSRQERDGLFMMLFLSILISLLPLLFSFFTKKQATDFAPFIAEIESFNHAANISNSFALAKQPFEKTTPSTSKNNLAKPFFFDPNQATKNDFIQLGLSAKTAQTILNFRNKGAFFSKKEDFKKVYGLKNTDYERLVDFIQIKKNNFPKSKFSENKVPVSYDSPTIRPTAFDPNTASKKILVQNGIPPQVASTIIKYRNSGAVFHNKKDLKKIYSLSDAVYQKIEPYIEISSGALSGVSASSANTANNPIININNSSPEDWQQLRGIGISFSKKIIRYRDKLGGFYCIAQVGETRGLPDSTFQNIQPFLRNAPVLRKINLNKVSEEELRKHPYISWNQAKLIVSYRNMHGDFKNVNELLKIGALKKEWVEKMKHYFF